MPATLPAPRVLFAIAVTVVVLAALGIGALIGGGDSDAGDTTSTTMAPPTQESAPPEAPADATTTSISIDPKWYPKRMSRYSDRQPAVTVTTLPTTTTKAGTSTTTADEDDDTNGGNRAERDRG